MNNADKSLRSGIIELNDLLEVNLKSIDLKFQTLNKHIEQIEYVKANDEFSLPLNQIQKKVNHLNDLIASDLNCKRYILLSKLEKSFEANLKKLSLKNENTLLFRQCVVNHNDWPCLIGSLLYQNKFSIEQKLRYLSVMNQFEEIKLEHESNMDADDIEDASNKCYIERVLLLKRDKIFIYIKTKDDRPLFKIMSNNFTTSNLTLNIMKKADSQLIYKNILEWNSKIVTLFADINNKYFFLEVFDEHLNLLARKKFNFIIHLCSLNDDEVICWNVNHKKCLIFDYKLKIIQKFGQESDATEPFYFADGTLIDASKNFILYYFYDDLNQTQFIKIICRQSGMETGRIHFEFNYFSLNMIKIDSKSNILMKLYDPNTLIKYYDTFGNLLSDFNNNEFEKFTRIDLNKNDDIICFDRLKNTIFIF